MRSLTLRASKRWLGDQARLARRAAALRAMLGVVVALAAWAGLGIVASLPAGQIGRPWLAVVVVVLLVCAELVQGLPLAFIELPGTFAAARRLGELARQVPKPAFVAAGPMPVDGSIVLRDLHYGRDRGLALIEDANFEIRSGEHLAMVGPSGCGKSSLLALLARLEEPDAGEMLHWPDGLETWVEEGGASLSGGQRRRLAIARALLRDAPIYLFDEATEGLDEKSEAALVKRLRERLAGRTLIWVTHKPLGLTAFDRVIGLENGRLGVLAPPVGAPA